MALALIHLIALHEDGSNNPIGVRSDINKILFHHYYVVKGFYGVIIFINRPIRVNFLTSLYIGGCRKF